LSALDVFVCGIINEEKIYFFGLFEKIEGKTKIKKKTLFLTVLNILIELL